ncbi:MAG: UDP-N-acetylmuramoyl-L-alanyl-D-glutamate--2,6-diaminopimelate ligase [Saprospiraceae bacterium]|nr:UDP-N-acetylmuramoyl-L-alanyl-D-glutamate--2,6-diaminopimelate ligase [Saprospiraceae bacterium]
MPIKIMKKLSEILRGVEILDSHGDTDTNISKIAFDSRKVVQNSLFVAVRGTQVDGHDFISKAIENGASAIICEEIPVIDTLARFIKVENASAALGSLAANFYDNPTQNLKVVGVTGTNGKTSTATLLYDLFAGLGYKCGLISTVEYRVASRTLPSTHTTPDQIALQQLFCEMVTEGCQFAFMEVSSHALAQNRVSGIQFTGAIFSNITHDHLDYHKTFENYRDAKKLLFDGLSKNAFALTNNDDRNGRFMLQNTKAQKYSYALRKVADFKAKIIENGLLGLHLDMDGHDFYARMIGEFNAYNLLAVYSAAVLLGADKLEVLTILSNLKGAEGRFDYIHDIQRDIVGIVDYAHTPDALENVLETIRHFRKGTQKIITLTGAGGDRDPAKRRIMGKIGVTLSDTLILTSDNPRSEDPLSIIEQMKVDIAVKDASKVLEIADRRQAIRTAVKLAQKGDIILLAGKGHEKYQEINGVKLPFDDKDELSKALKE